ncbi:carboxypeptidase-like regulatory domain-containing protein [Dysgonomonas sp. BGC7]|uniref:carboxypeptidase-like regulatory domain-containing protein n=1 Tax=Dysgonomonas sp. BGC7 TaxID=1658008 RepID=UPI0012F80A7F|nr:carboxypeptidase-like regulatory domain-containing protein [Dysgonomonas sp. BGC7]MBD8388412.1 carboxypeptidase-like regulatory domain-containing protein [Dysgonomonas sp. BGC7]
MKILIIIISLCIGTISIVAQNTVLEKRITVVIKNMPMDKAVEKIAAEAGIHVSYSSDLFSDCDVANIEAKDHMLLTVLNKLFEPYKIAYTVHAGQLIIYPKKTIIVKEYTIRGSFCNSDTHEPISYATLQIKGKPKGVIADHEGYFEFTISELELTDSLTASCLGYERRTFSSDSLLVKPEIIISLKGKSLEIDPVTVEAVNSQIKKYKKAGNRSWFTTGSMYLDTHGQQVALYIENKKKENGYIRTISYHLSKNGNVEAPFRVRILEQDIISKAPGKDLLQEILVVQPPQNTDGWYDVDLTEYNISIPDNGFFVAIQGVFPNDYSYYANDSGAIERGKRNTKGNDDFSPKSIHYGQRINYSGKGGSNTWHYSLSHQWFQMEKDNYSVKISAEIGIYSDK